MHVESVAWVAERKDVLSTFFFLLTLGAYTQLCSSRARKAAPVRNCRPPQPPDPQGGN